MTAVKRFRTAVLPIFLLITLFVAGCVDRAPVKIGFVAGLTGRQSDIGVAGRNGVILAVEEINKAGGIAGRQVELIVKDDKNDPAVVRRVDAELINTGVRTIIGHMTSVAAVASLPVIAGGKALIISPTARADSLSGHDDFLITVMPPLSVSAQAQASYAVDALGLNKMAVIYDITNGDFSQSWLQAFTAKYEELGGTVAITYPFISGKSVDYVKLANTVGGCWPEGVLIIAGAVDAALLSQWLKKNQPAVPLFSSSWAMTDDFIHHGGSAVEGVVFSSPFIPDPRGLSYSRFVRVYQERFGSRPNYAAAYGYEAAQLLAAGIKQAGNTEAQAVKAAILAQGQFPGLWSEIVINATGDSQRLGGLITVKDGQFTPLIN
ncbi:ABC transporter substrate-binding protein [Sporomusa termitida]|uniref:Leu/Ile/Val-binding protein n=1 Tax=Sporomusa termitida TaxID=2377 RepID=A0A517E135_9FIRM|nr:ABC transporter substrate-binding protein [Sporomusa termitida]QDR83312.1 Leu/Ile/Val-binding protein [Sporomusa termitida]